MTVRNELPEHPIELVSQAAEPAGEVLYTSTRIMVDSHSRPRCTSCRGAIDHGVQYKCLTIRDDNGDTAEFEYCAEECLDTHLDQLRE